MLALLVMATVWLMLAGGAADIRVHQDPQLGVRRALLHSHHHGQQWHLQTPPGNQRGEYRLTDRRPTGQAGKQTGGQTA